MKQIKWKFAFGAALILFSIIMYFLHYSIFGNTEYIFNFLIAQLGFLPISVLLVTVVINQLLTMREKRNRIRKINMVIGAFFNEVGIKLLEIFSELDNNSEELKKQLIMTDEWTEENFKNICRNIDTHTFKSDLKDQKENLEQLQTFVQEKRSFSLRLLQNPNLLEHESFTELLLAYFHLTEELVSRKNIKELSDMDYEHLEKDIARTYSKLITEWLSYMQHLKKEYPYMFSYALRMNPFNPYSTVEIK